MFSDFDADPLLIHPSLNHGMGIVAAAQILKEKSVALDPSQTYEKYFCVGMYNVYVISIWDKSKFCPADQSRFRFYGRL